MIPLHRGARWRESVLENALKLSQVAHVIVSDAEGADDTLRRLGADLAGLPGIELLEPRDLPAGWVAHANDLQARARTPYVMWMSQDDSVDPVWVVNGEIALDATPEAVLAVGSMELLEEGSSTTLPPIAEYAHPDSVERVRSSLRRQFFMGPPGLGHAFRGVQRASTTIPLPTVRLDSIDASAGWKADVLWALAMLSRGPFAPIDALYRKTVHSTSASHAWEPENLTPGFRSLVTESLIALPIEARLALVTELWDEEAARLRRRVRMLERRARKGEESASS